MPPNPPPPTPSSPQASNRFQQRTGRLRLREGRTQSRAPAASGAPRGPPGRVSLAIGGVLSLLPPARRCRVDSCVIAIFLGLPGAGPPGPSAGVGRACARTCGPPLALHDPATQREGGGSKRGRGDSAPCVAGRGRGAGAPPAPGMRARALASTFFLPLSRLEPPLAYSGERECTDQHPCRAPGPGTPGNVSQEARKLLRVSSTLWSHPAPPGCPAT